MNIWTKAFWKASAERAAKTAGQSALLAIGADQVSAWSLDYLHVAGFAVGGALLSVLTSVASSKVGNDGPSLVQSEQLAVAPRRH